MTKDMSAFLLASDAHRRQEWINTVLREFVRAPLTYLALAALVDVGMAWYVLHLPSSRPLTLAADVQLGTSVLAVT